MNPFNSNKEQPGDYFPEPTPKKSFPLKTVGIVVGGLFAVAHVGLLGYLMQETKPNYPVINFPSEIILHMKWKQLRTGIELNTKQTTLLF